MVFRYLLRLVFASAVLAIGVATVAQTGSTSANGERQALQRGQKAIQSNDLAGARAEFEKAVRLAPNDAEAQSALGWVLAEQGEADAAVVHLRAAIKAKPGFVE